MIRIDESDLKDAMRHLGRAMAKAEHGKTIKRETAKKLRRILKPLVDERRARVRALPSKGHAGEGMRAAIARKTNANTRWSGRDPGVSIRVRGRGMPRGFRFAGRAFNREGGWNPTTLGGIVEHQEMQPAQWFDGANTKDRPMVRKEVIAALSDAADKIAADIRRIR